MHKYIFPILVFLLQASSNVTTYDLIQFEQKFYLANSYKPYTGRVVDYYENGIKKVVGYYDRGIKSGTWLEFYMSGEIKSEIIYEKVESIYTSFFKDGNIESFGMLNDDARDGMWINFDTDGNEKYHSYYSSGKLDSMIAIPLPAILDQDSMLVSLIDSTEFIKIDQHDIGNEDIELKNGEYTTYFDSGKFLIEFYKDNFLEGISTTYFADGKKNIERVFSNGELIKRTSEYNNLGLLVSIYEEKIDDNKLIKDGEYIAYYPNGSIYEIGYLKDGYRFGQWFNFDKNGLKMKDLFYDTTSVAIESVETYIVNYFPTGEKKNEYLARSYLDCNENIDCDVYDGNQHKVESKNGDFTSFYKNGIIKSKGKYLDNVKEGKWYEYYQNGKILSSIDYINGNGLYTSYYNSGDSLILSLGYYIDEKRNGLWNEYDINHELIRKYYYKDDILDINHQMEVFYKSNELDDDYEYDINNPLIKMRFYCKGTPDKYLYDGIYEEYYLDNNLKSIGIYKNGIKYGYWKEFYKDNILKSTVDFDEYGNGNYESYLNTGEISSIGTYKDYLKDGKWVTYYPNGNVEWILFYLNDRINPNKLCSNWYESGYKRTEGFLVDFENKIIWDGKYIEYYENGIIYLQGNYSNGKKDGDWIEYYQNRVVKNQGEFSDNKEIGKWTYYNEDGELIKTKIYE